MPITIPDIRIISYQRAKKLTLFAGFVSHASAPLAQSSGEAFVHDGRGFRRHALLCSFFVADIPCTLRAWSPRVGAAVAALMPDDQKSR